VSRIAVLALLAAVLALTACGESDEETAQKQVCDSRSDVKSELDDLSALTPSTITVAGVQQSLQSIVDALQQMRSAQKDLNGERKQQLQSANQQFEASVKQTLSSLGSSTSLSDAGSRLEQSFSDLASSYEQTLAKVDC
jgi:Tfp pilus assembly protein PilP